MLPTWVKRKFKGQNPCASWSWQNSSHDGMGGQISRERRTHIAASVWVLSEWSHRACRWSTGCSDERDRKHPWLLTGYCNIYAWNGYQSYVHQTSAGWASLPISGQKRYHCTLETTITDCLFHLKQKKKDRKKKHLDPIENKWHCNSSFVVNEILLVHSPGSCIFAALQQILVWEAWGSFWSSGEVWPTPWCNCWDHRRLWMYSWRHGTCSCRTL